MAKKLQDFSTEELQAVRSDYVAGLMGVRDVGEKHGVSAQTLYNWAHKFGWERNLSHKIREKRDRDLALKEAVARRDLDVATANLSDDEIIEENAQVQAAIVQMHKGAIKTLRERSQKIDGELEGCWEEIAKETKLQNRVGLLKTISDIVKNQAQVLAQLIPLERQAYNMDGERDVPTEDELDVYKIRDQAVAQLEAYVRVTQIRRADEEGTIN
jgi:CRISPR/Cas system-associated protein Cas10 (large subunit of type III CRISPR-Cas system)